MGRFALLCVLVSAVAGCVEPPPVLHCVDELGTELVCPLDRACGGRHGCVDPSQLTACAGVVDGEPCSFAGDPTGYCDSGVCIGSDCGNGVVDGDEACDGDGCELDCRSRIECGNGIANTGERCDDGNLRSHDGCDSRCLPESATWTEVRQVDHPLRQSTAYSYDPIRQRLLGFGGVLAAQRTNTTFEWDSASSTWRQLVVDPDPGVLSAASMVYDPVRRNSVLFGGIDAANAILRDTWLWTGREWQQAAVGGPRGRYFAALAFDPIRQRAVLFGGLGEGAEKLGDTWLWDGSAWTQATPAESPSVRERAAFGFDPVHGHAVLHGGIGGTGTLADTWTWNGATWTQHAVTMPTSHSGTLTWDVKRQQLVLASSAGTYGWTGTTWELLGPSPGRARHYAFYDAVREQVVVGGGLDGSEQRASMLGFTGNAWQSIAAAPAPGPRIGMGLAYDARRGVVMLYGGRDPDPPPDQIEPPPPQTYEDTWELGGAGWRRVATTITPGKRTRGALAYDKRRQRMVLFGGENANAAVWEWDGATWTTSFTSGAGPVARYDHGAVYDDALGRIVVFGGRAVVGGTSLGDTWSWDGTQWHEHPGASPAPRHWHGLAYDALAGGVVLYGGHDGTQRFEDTWTWDATSGWTELAPTLFPRRRYLTAFDQHPSTGELILFGGHIGNGGTAQTWHLDQTTTPPTWARLAPSTPPPAQYDGRFAADRARGDLVLFGKHGTWRLGYESETPAETCTALVDLDGDGAVGCDDPDCDAYCAPGCPILTSCDASPRCGDNTCDPLESCRLCADDCGVCTARCGDGLCDAGDCAADCP